VQRLGDSGRGVDVLQVPRAPATCRAPRAMRHAPRAVPRATRDATWRAAGRARRATRVRRQLDMPPMALDALLRKIDFNSVPIRQHPPFTKHTLTMCARACTHRHTHPHPRENATRAAVRHSRHDRHQMTGTLGYYGVLESTQGRRAARLRRRRRRPLILRQHPRRPPPLRHEGTAAHGGMYAAPLWAGPVGSQAPRVLTRVRAPRRRPLPSGRRRKSTRECSEYAALAGHPDGSARCVL
jgi:hypothetical protein